MIDVFKFYFNQMVKVLMVMDSWVIVPGVTFLGLLLGCSILITFIKLIKFGVHSYEKQYWNSLVRDSIPKKRGVK